MRFLFFRLQQLILKFLRFFFSVISGGLECIVCGGFSCCLPVCPECQKKEFDVGVSLASRRCSVCGKILVSEEEKCMECRENPVFSYADSVYPLFDYRLWNKELLFVWKMMEVRSLSWFFSEKISEGLKYIEEKVIIPVPPRKGKIAKKGWDQIEDLCLFLEKYYGFTVLRILKRNTGKEQKKLGREERIETIGKSFSLVSEKELCKRLKVTGGRMPESCCLIDDILTTGSTAESCSRVLKEGGIKKVSVMSLFTAS